MADLQENKVSSFSRSIDDRDLWLWQLGKMFSRSFIKGKRKSIFGLEACPKIWGQIFFFSIATLKLEPHQQQQLRAPAQPPKKWPEPGLETLSFSKRAPAFDPSSSRFWPLKTRIFGCTFLTHHLSELYNLCSRGVKSLPRKIFHTFFVKKTAKVSQPESD